MQLLKVKHHFKTSSLSADIAKNSFIPDNNFGPFKIF